MAFHHRRQLRRWATSLLLAWLFGVIAGVANACVVSFPAHEVQAHGGHEEGDHDGGGKDACHDFCEKSSATVPSTASAEKQGHQAAPALPMSAAWVPALDSGRAIALPSGDARPRAAPIPIAFLRLAL